MLSYTPLNSRSKYIITLLLNAERYLSVEDISIMLNISRRTFYYEFKKINAWLREIGTNEIDIVRNKGAYLTAPQREKIKMVQEEFDSESYYIYSQDERIQLVLCSILASKDSVYTDLLCSICDVSKKTIIQDIKRVKKECNKYGLDLRYHNSTGYEVVGEAIRKRSLFLYYVSDIIQFLDHSKMKWYRQDEVMIVFNQLKTVERALGAKYVDGVLFRLAVLISVQMEENRVVDERIDYDEIMDSAEFLFIGKHMPQFSQTEQIYITMHLLSSRIQIGNKHYSNRTKEELVRISGIAEELIDEFQRLSCINFDEKDLLKEQLIKHLSISLYRYRFGFIDNNPVVYDVENQYPELFGIVKLVSDRLSVIIGYPISKSEVAYLTMHFGAFVIHKREMPKTFDILLVCPNGISTTNMLKIELTRLSPLIRIVDVISDSALEEYVENHYLIVSTVPLETKRSYLKINPVMHSEDRENILSLISKNTTSVTDSIRTEAIFDLVKKYIDEDDHENLHKDLVNFLKSNSHKTVNTQLNIQKHLSDVMDIKSIQIVDRVENWRRSIRLASEQLLYRGAITERYINSMIQAIETFGTYNFVSKDVILAHAGPEDGAKKMGVSVLKVREGIYFNEKDSAKIIIVLVPIDKESHLGILNDLVEIIYDKEKLEALLAIEAEEEMLEFMTVSVQ